MKTITDFKDQIAEYLYLVSYKKNQKDIFHLEMEALLGKELNKNYFVTNKSMDVSRSVFFRSKIDIMYKANSLNDLERQIQSDVLYLNEYKIRYVKTEDKIGYEERLEGLRVAGTAIEGNFAISEPLIELALTRLNNEWILGRYAHNPDDWKLRKQKPQSYSNALEVQMAKSLLNIAVGNNKKAKIIDPCCGIGTVVIEGRAMGLDITGFDMNRLVVKHCNQNLLHFGYEGDVIKKDMLTIEESYDVAILDIPYGLLSVTSSEKQSDLIRKTREISTKAVIVSMDEVEELILKNDFRIVNQCTVAKSNVFKRHIYICE